MQSIPFGPITIEELDKDQFDLWELLFASTMWGIWKVRRIRLFDNALVPLREDENYTCFKRRI